MVPGGGFESPSRHHFNANRSIKPTLQGYVNPKFIVNRRISYYGFNYGMGYTSAMGVYGIPYMNSPLDLG